MDADYSFGIFKLFLHVLQKLFPFTADKMVYFHAKFKEFVLKSTRVLPGF